MMFDRLPHRGMLPIGNAKFLGGLLHDPRQRSIVSVAHKRAQMMHYMVIEPAGKPTDERLSRRVVSRCGEDVIDPVVKFAAAQGKVSAVNTVRCLEYEGHAQTDDQMGETSCLWVNYANGTNIIAIGTTAASSPLIARITAQDCSPIVGGIDIGKGASDVLFGFTVPQPGVYPFRLVWENGGGGASCEWFVRDPALGDFLVGDPAGPVKAWITRDVHFAGALPAPRLNTPTVSGANVIISWTGEGELWESYSLTGPWFKSTFQSNPATVVPSPLLTDRFFRVRQY